MSTVTSLVYPEGEKSAFPLDGVDFNSSLYFDITSLGNVTGSIIGHHGDVGVDGNSTDILFINGTRRMIPGYNTRRPFSSYASLHRTMRLLTIYTCPIILVLGLLSNILAYLVVTRTRLRKVPSVPYLAAMAVVDSGALVTDFIQTGLLAHGVNLIGMMGVCQYVTFLHFAFLFLCVWYPVALCVEKFISVYCPLRKAGLCTPFRAKVVIISMAVITGVCFYYVIYMVGVQETLRTSLCMPFEHFHKDYNILMKLNSVFVNLLPTAALIVLVALIYGRGYEYYRISSAAEVPGRQGSTRNSSNRSPYRVTNVIFPVVFVMLILKSPTGFFQVYGNMKPPEQVPMIFRHLLPVFLYIDRLNLAVKFYVYLAFSPSFRRRTRSLICGFRAKINGQCRRNSSDDEIDAELASGGIPRITMTQRGNHFGASKTCRMASNV
ncbi:uncharacterized protein LOC101863229 [Aplysia californica]|uniref:Uncharacterized protein LOC101863229 n=1 Tax=Aplysia californica TaxID=6500 RepID=A0ABM0JCL8_APLCA|nr:uncharacterized protein LOC101863229 [Aplysia californica]